MNLEPLICRSILEGIDPPSALLPWRLDKPVYSATSTTYADILKKNFSTTLIPTTQTATNTHPHASSKLCLLIMTQMAQRLKLLPLLHPLQLALW